jgi:hypothetical protein
VSVDTVVPFPGSSVRPGGWVVPPTLRAVWRMADLGWRLFPLQAGRKIPLGGTAGCKDATDDRDQLDRWFLRGNLNVGLATGADSRIWVLDVDIKKDDKGALIEDGHATLAALIARHGALPDTVECRTPGGGRHLYFAWPAKGEVRNSARTKLGAGLDTRGVGGYVVVPPSVRSDVGGKAYEWVVDPLVGGEVKLAPAWLLKLVQGEARAEPAPADPETGNPVSVSRSASPPPDRMSAYARKVLDNQVGRLRSAGPGTRSDTLNEVSFILGQWVAGGSIPEDLALHHMRAAIGGWGADKTPKKTTDTLERGFVAGKAQPRTPPAPRFGRSAAGPAAVPGRGRSAPQRELPPPADVETIWSAADHPDHFHGIARLLDGIGIASHLPPPSIRARGDLPWPPSGEGAGACGPVTALVAAVARSGRPRAALWLVAVDDDGRPTAPVDPLTGEVVGPGLMLGPGRGGAIRLGEPAPGGSLVVAAGLSTALRLKAGGRAGGVPIWAVPQLDDLAAADLPTDIRQLTVAAPHANAEAAAAAARTFARPGRLVLLLKV